MCSAISEPSQRRDHQDSKSDLLPSWELELHVSNVQATANVCNGRKQTLTSGPPLVRQSAFS